MIETSPPPRCHTTVVGLAVLLVAAVLTPLRGEEPAEEEESGPVHIFREPDGQVVLTLNAEAQQRIALTVADVETATAQAMAIAYGRLESDPSHSFTLRAPARGVLRASPARPWPEIGSILEPNTVIGHVEPRFTASEVVDLCARKLDAQAEFEAVIADVEAVRASYKSKNRLNAEQGLVSDRSMEETRARLKGGEARLNAAKQKVDLYESLVAGRASENVLRPVTTADFGEVIDIMARPGELIEEGQVLLRTARYDSLIARVSLFAGDLAVAPVPEVSITVEGDESPVLTGTPIGPAPQASPLTGGQALLFRVDAPASIHLRPGVTVVAHVPTAGPPKNGVRIPRGAVLRYGGRTWAYVKTGGDRFERRDMVLGEPTSDGWIATSGAAPGEKVVVGGAQLLLSEELKAQIENEEEAEE